MNVCVKTGAVVHVQEYNGQQVADLYLVGRAILVRFGCGGPTKLTYPHEEVGDTRPPTHTIHLKNGLWRDDLGFALVPLENVTGPLVLSNGEQVVLEQGRSIDDAVSFAVMTPDGVSPLGWMDMRLYKEMVQRVTLYPGCRYVFAYSDGFNG